jgi:chromosome segregation ATPase
MFSFLNKKKREIERLNVVVKELTEKNEHLERSIRIVQSNNSLLEREKDSMINRIKSYEDQIKKLNLTLGDINRNDNNSRYY